MKVTKDILIRGGVSLKSRHNEDDKVNFKMAANKNNSTMKSGLKKQSLPLSKCKVANTILI